MRGLGYLAILLSLALPLATATPVLSHALSPVLSGVAAAEGGVEGAQGPPPPPERLPLREHDGRGPETPAWGLPETAGRAETVHPTSLHWQIETIDSAGQVGLYTSLVLDPSTDSGQRAAGRPHISYCRLDPYTWVCAALKYAYFDGSAWLTKTVDNTGYVGAHTSLALDASGRPHISYYEGWPNYDLKYAHFDGSTWLIQTIDDGGDVGEYTSLTLDAAGQPHISYYDVTKGDLKYAHFDGSTWLTETVDSAGDAGAHTSLALDASGHPHISYYDHSNGDLKYAHFDGASWITETVDSAGNVGAHTSLALDAAGRPHISYLDRTDEDLKYAHFDGASWVTEPVDSAGYVGMDSSLALDASGRPHISYHDHLHSDLKYARYDGAAWQIEVVDSAGAVGGYTSLALDAFGRPHISYFDDSNDDLKYAWGEGECVPVAGVSIEGPATLPVGQPGLYAASYTPPTVSLPVNLTWDNGSVGPTAAYSWTVAGNYTLTVTATNCGGQAAASFAVEVFCQPLEGVGLSGPGALLVGQEGTYQAAPEPITASLPLTFTWDSGRSCGTVSNSSKAEIGGAVGPTAVYSWSATGTYTITVTGTNICGGEAVGQLPVRVLAEWPHQVYLPLVVRGW